MLSTMKQQLRTASSARSHSAPHVGPHLCHSLSRARHLVSARAVVQEQGLGLSTRQVELFLNQGFLVLPGAATRSECDALKQRVNELVQDFDPDSVRSIFSTKNQAALTDSYFFDSASNVSYFFEEKAFDAEGVLVRPKELAINKIGHALHDLDPLFRSCARSPYVTSILRSLGYRRPLPVQSMYIFKQPHIGGEVVPHQDSSFLITDPPSCVGLWWALEDATKANGCLWAMPGVHKEGLKRRFVRNESDKVSYDAPPPEYDLSTFEPVECPAGTLVLLHGENVHYSCENTSPVSRHSFSMHVVESVAGYNWHASNWAHRDPSSPWVPIYDDTTLADGGTPTGAVLRR